MTSERFQPSEPPNNTNYGGTQQKTNTSNSRYITFFCPFLLIFYVIDIF